MYKNKIIDDIIAILHQVSPDWVTSINMSLFSKDNNFVARDIAYLYLKLEKEYEVNIEQMVRNISNVTVDEIASAVYKQTY